MGSVEGSGDLMELDSAAPSDAAVARIMDAGGRPAGAGFLTRNHEVLTCAHVVAMALGLRREAAQRPTGRLWVDFPLAEPGTRVEARIESWTPVSADGTGDVAVLRLLAEPPPKARTARLVEGVAGPDRRVRTFGFPSGHDDGTWSVGWLRGRQGTGWLQYDTDPASQHRVEPGFSGAPVWDIDEGGVVGMVVAADSAAGIRTAYVIPTKKLREAWSPLSEASLTACPFRSLDSFQERDAPLFHGREQPVRQIVDLLGHAPVTSLVGPSGCGKSSLLYAGVLPRLRERAPETEVVTFRPGQLGRTPLTALAHALLPVLEPDLTETARLAELPGLTELLREGQMSAIVDRVLVRQGKQRLLVVADQFEEALLDAREADLDPLAGALAYSLEAGTRLQVLISMRADFLTSALNRPTLVPLLGGDRLFTVGAMSDSELREAVVNPLKSSGVVYEPGLVDRILGDLGSDPGRLPLLEFTLTKLWERQQRGVMGHGAYEALGRVNDALVNHAEQVWTSGLTEEEHRGARALLVQLVHPAAERTAPTRRTVARSELPPDQWRIAQRLMSTRLVVPGEEFRLGGGPPEETVELAHETLLTQWHRLREFVEADHEFRSWQEGLRRSMARSRTRERAGRWHLLGDAQLNGTELREARRWRSRRKSELSPAEAAFIDAAARRARRGLLALTSLVLTVTLVAGLIFYLDRSGTSDRAAAQASRVLVQQSRDAQQDMATAGGSYTALLLALRAYRTRDTAEARALLAEMYERYGFADLVVPRYTSAMSVINDPVSTFLTFSVADTAGRVIVSTAADGEVVVWRGDGSEADRLPTGRKADITAVSPDGSLVAMANTSPYTTGAAPDVRGEPALLFDTATGKVRELERPREGDSMPEFDEEEELLPGIEMPDLTDLPGLPDFSIPTQYARFAFAPGNDLLIGQTGLFGEGGRLILWDVADGGIRKILPGLDEPVDGMWMHPDGKRLVTLTEDYDVQVASTHSSLRMWDLDGPKPEKHDVLTWTVPSDGFTTSDISADLTRIALVDVRTEGLKVSMTTSVHELPGGKRLSHEQSLITDVPAGITVPPSGGAVRMYALVPDPAESGNDPVTNISGQWQEVDILGTGGDKGFTLLSDFGLMARVGPGTEAGTWNRLPEQTALPNTAGSPSPKPPSGISPARQMRRLCRILGDQTLPPGAKEKIPPGAHRGSVCP